MASRSFTLITGVCIVSIAATLVTAQPPAAIYSGRHRCT